ncbi:MAG TPA: 4Fe-4S dicluster domain-containing protein [Gemmatimonadales bacterium]|nr:4Fe-4S dicluster domain-containing protein [Gemmatimonadales bacterium]
MVGIPGLPDFSDRRTLFRNSFGKWVEHLMEQAERRVAPQRLLRPPGALPEVAFLAACTRCGECITACPPFALRKAPTESGLQAGTPYIDPTVQACVVCDTMPCVRACPTDALTLPPDGWAGYRLAALELLPERCVTFSGTPCRACADACPVGERALAIDENGNPVLKAEGCVGCGSCVRACITSPPSLRIRPLEG